MNPFLFLLLALLTPFGLCLCLLTPIYISMFVAVVAVYHHAVGFRVLLHKFPDIFYIIEAYNQLYTYWEKHIFDVGFFTYTLPVAVLPLAAVFFSMWLTRKFFRKMGDIFQVNVRLE